MPEKKRTPQQIEADNKAREARDKPFHEKKKAREEEDKRRKARGRMTVQEEKRWPYMTKEERRVIEDRLERERAEMPSLAEKLGNKRKEDTKRYAAGDMTAAEKLEYEANTPKVSPLQELNPHLKFDENGNPIFPEQKFWENQPGYHVNMPTLTREQMDFAKSLLPMVSKQLPGLLNNLSNLPVNNMFGHMSNPVLQGLMNPNQAMFPSQIQNQMSPMMEGLLGGLGAQGGQYVGEKIPEWWKYAQQNAPAAYDYAVQSRPGQFVGNLPGNIMDALSGLVNRFRGQQQG